MSLPDALPNPEKPGSNFKNSPYRMPLRAMLVLFVIVVIMECLVIIRIIDVSDYLSHIEAAVDISKINFSYFLYQYLTSAIDTLIPFANIYAAGILTALLSYVVLVAVIVTSFHRQMRGRHPWMAVILTLALILSAPILLLNLQSGRYFGYQHPFTYHSPTSALMRPIALIIFLYTACAFLPPVATWFQVGSAVFMSVLLNLAKPSYSVAFLPAAGLMMVYRLVRRLFVDFKMLVAILGTITLVLAVQYLIDFASKDGGIAFRPFYVLLQYRNQEIGAIVIKQLLSIVFPLSMLALYWKAARHDVMLMLAWGCFLVGWFYALCMVDVALAADNNFYWSGEITLFVLFFASVHFWLRQMGNRFDLSTRRAQIVMAIWSLHLVSGVIWYAAQMTRSTFF